MKKQINFFLALFFIAAFSWYIFLFEPNNLQVEKLEIKMENLPFSFNGMKIVQLSDLHSKNFGGKEKKVLKIIEQINPDFIFITGDFIDRATKDIESCQEFWRALSEKYENRVYGVMGNHEYWNPNYHSIKQNLIDSGINILNNENVKLIKDDDFIYLIGVDDPHSSYDNLFLAMKGISNKNILKILLAHSPEIIEDAKIKNINLILVGHTHGGQVKIPFVRPIWVPTKDHGKYASGLFKINDSYLYVNRGVGVGFLPIRFNCPPEITLIKIEK
ncbi:MAG: phosphohydrolase [Parcubacteria group bacterium Athens1014_10]|nr:MAG: phosphohydrolase [Parcubacteria group bacterium Athens1014_10]TSD06043.1 MAG: phosphohydrolase [Parcubacteria group bacterium Athens0714_12]